MKHIARLLLVPCWLFAAANFMFADTLKECMDEDISISAPACEKVIAENKEPPDRMATAYYSRGFNHKENSELDLAIADYSRAISLVPHYLKAYSLRAWAFDAQGQSERAIADFLVVLSMEPNKADALSGIGVQYHVLKQFDKALEFLDKAILADPESAYAYNARANTYRLIGKHDEAVRDYTKAIKIEPSEIYLNNRGVMFAETGRDDLAVMDYNSAIAANPGYAPAYYDLGLYWQKVHDKEKAMSLYKKALEVEPGYQLAVDAMKKLEQRK